MVSSYTILGKQVASHWIAIATLTTAIGGAVIPSYLPKSTPTTTEAKPAVVQTSKDDDIDVEKLLNDFLKEEEK